MLEFTPFASSSAGCAYRLSGGGASAPLLIDAGLQFREIQRAMQFRVTKLAGCLLTHAHGDHARSVKELMQAGVDIWASPETHNALEGLGHGHRRQLLIPGTHQLVGDWLVHPFEAIHDAPGTLGFVIDSRQGDRLLFLTDSAYSPYTFTGLTHVAIEANYASSLIKGNTVSGKISTDRYRRTTSTHMSLERLIDMLQANDLSRVEEIHLLHLSDENSDEEAFKLAVQRATGKPVYVAGSRVGGAR